MRKSRDCSVVRVRHKVCTHVCFGATDGGRPPRPPAPMLQPASPDVIASATTARAAQLFEVQLAARVEAEVAAKVESELKKRVEAEVAARVEAELAAKVMAQVTARLEAAGTAKVEAVAGDRAEAAAARAEAAAARIEASGQRVERLHKAVLFELQRVGAALDALSAPDGPPLPPAPEPAPATAEPASKPAKRSNSFFSSKRRARGGGDESQAEVRA